MGSQFFLEQPLQHLDIAHATKIRAHDKGYGPVRAGFIQVQGMEPMCPATIWIRV